MRKVFILIVIVFSLSFLGGCKKKEPVEITREEILSFKGSYYVYFYGEDCPACVETTAKLRELIKKNRITCYFFNTTINPIGVTGDPGYHNIGVNIMKNIKIRVTPTLIRVENKTITEEYDNSRLILNKLNEYDVNLTPVYILFGVIATTSVILGIYLFITIKEKYRNKKTNQNRKNKKKK
ncbi:MAG: hypothetical protein ACOX02_03215 [Acholeplasmatales bacterium]